MELPAVPPAATMHQSIRTPAFTMCICVVPSRTPNQRGDRSRNNFKGPIASAFFFFFLCCAVKAVAFNEKRMLLQ